MVQSLRGRWCQWWHTTCAICQSIRTALIWLAQLLYAGLALYGSYLLIVWWIDTAPVIQFGQGRAEPINVKAGQVTVVYQPALKLRECNGHVYRYLDGACGKLPIQEGEATLPQSFSGNLILPIEIPTAAMPGACELKAIHQYWCTPFDYLFPRLAEPMPVPFVVMP